MNIERFNDTYKNSGSRGWKTLVGIVAAASIFFSGYIIGTERNNPIEAYHVSPSSMDISTQNGSVYTLPCIEEDSTGCIRYMEGAVSIGSESKYPLSYHSNH